MAENDGAKNQGQQRSGQSKEVENRSAEQIKLDRAAKERERRRRKRRRKAELLRLQKDTLKKDTAGEQMIPVRPKIGPEPEHVVEQPQPPSEAEHPMIHKTHSFTGPLIEPEAVLPSPVEPESASVAESVPPIEPVAEPEPEPKAEPEPPQEHNFNPEPLSEPQQEQPQEYNFNPEPVSEPAPKSEMAHEAELAHAVQTEDLVIHSEHEQVRPVVDMHEGPVPELPPEESPFEVPHDEQPEEVEPVRNPKEASKNDEPLHKPEHQPTREQRETSEETLPESEGLNERKSAFQGAGGFSAGIFKTIGSALRNFFLKLRWGRVFGFLLLVIVGGGLYAGYLFKVHEKVYDFVSGFFKAPPPVAVNVDDELLREWGITSAMIFGDNRGSNRDLLADQLFDAYYFGFLSEPKLQGETGITPAYYYGARTDLTAQTDQFIEYISNLRELAGLYEVNVYQMLDQTTDRPKALDDYVAKLKAIQDKSTAFSNEITQLIAGTKASYDSLTPDKTQFETDFFASLKGLDGQQSDFLLKSFVDVSQKQVELKAKFSALQQLASYYASSLQKFAIRITAIEKNREALVQGIHVVDIPGANLDIIIKATP